MHDGDTSHCYVDAPCESLPLGAIDPGKGPMSVPACTPSSTDLFHTVLLTYFRRCVPPDPMDKSMRLPWPGTMTAHAGFSSGWLEDDL
ncbi:hypothetical protein H112_05455 [Trichophyton rubrum D6]|uniref:Uncharacterized protein n=2 Tax=Trichophyton TaxID=5550 RepID=A0A022VYC2_TRIRU|nr:hypothetical protein H100_05472 [Trichophyton rubrum MR850]EZF40583.1 hypothetical protein H102_05438 [Trichophyton rubrum CBS 100081]EZF51252.1 hypothetical protein H103_05465 [Trichophyton rubrum CBS 288.86]EZF61777.1 hypothetical protein H104_05454 [Trichophyton rubrum CBS 289.86]EZF72435.1 hypothetical protein H105_05481 [Trichophyton soudanense CBS 452.61]EZF83143.1 hypothetical protein H110_05461 [Trichophyton rubrum MR1448]EZF93851.1 hypothetical protein H113_05509 [Trichophyton rub